jgi:hypothetical protein
MTPRILAVAFAVSAIATPVFAQQTIDGTGPWPKTACPPRCEAPTSNRESGGGRSWNRRKDSSDNAAVDRLNDQSYDAARQGRASGGSGAGDMSAPVPGGGTKP